MNSRASIRQFNPAQVADISRDLVAMFEELCRPSLDFTTVQGETFKSLDLRWYERVTTALRGVGYRPVADVQENAVIPAELAPGFRRLLLAADGHTRVEVSHTVWRHQLRLRNFFRTWAWDKGKYSIQFTTEFSDGSFCETTTEPQVCDVGPGFTVQHLPVNLSVQTILLRHKQLVLRYLRDRSSLEAVKLAGLTELFASINRAQAKRAQERLARGVFSEAELWRLGHAPALASHLAAEMRRQRGLLAPGA